MGEHQRRQLSCSASPRPRLRTRRCGQWGVPGRHQPRRRCVARAVAGGCPTEAPTAPPRARSASGAGSAGAGLAGSSAAISSPQPGTSHQRAAASAPAWLGATHRGCAVRCGGWRTLRRSRAAAHARAVGTSSSSVRIQDTLARRAPPRGEGERTSRLFGKRADKCTDLHMGGIAYTGPSSRKASRVGGSLAARSATTTNEKGR